jgi:hypothetical protein
MNDPLPLVLADLFRVVPEVREFPSLEELGRSSERLVEEFPGVARLEVAGRSAEGRRIDVLAIGHGPRHALLIGAPHPNEPIGTLTLEFLARFLCEREELRSLSGFTWLIVKAADPDGLVLNEGWMKAPFSLLQYALHCYCPPPSEQVEWGFPVEYGTLRFTASPPETRALLGLIERYRPVFLCSLHNATFGGVYFYVSERRPSLFRALQEAAGMLGLPLHRGEPEAPYVEAWDTGIYRLFGAPEVYDFLARHLRRDPSRELAAGTTSSDYLKRRVPEAFSLVCEVPHLTDPALSDPTPAGISRREAAQLGLARTGRIVGIVDAHFRALEPTLPPGRLARAIAEFTRGAADRLAARRRALEAEDYSREATRAEVFDTTVCRPFHAARFLGLASRLAGSVGDLGRAAELRRELEAAVAEIEAQSHFEIVPLRRSVALQAAACLLPWLRAPGSPRT